MPTLYDFRLPQRIAVQEKNSNSLLMQENGQAYQPCSE